MGVTANRASFLSNNEEKFCKKYGLYLLCLSAIIVLAVLLGLGYWFHTLEIDEKSLEKDELRVEYEGKILEAYDQETFDCENNCPAFTRFPVDCQRDSDKCDIRYDYYCTQQVDCLRYP